MKKPPSKYVELRTEYPYTDILGWSHSRYAEFTSCKRKYYYERYGKHDLENFDKIRGLKSLTSIPLEIGNISHKVCETLLTRLQRRGGDIDLHVFKTYTENRAKEICSTKAFEEVHYRKFDIIDIERQIITPVLSGMMNLIKSERFKWLCEEALVTAEDWYVEHSSESYYGEFRVSDLKAFCKVDFMFPIDDELYIVDWKTGKQDSKKHFAQLRAYAAWANIQFGVEVSKIKPVIAYLLDDYSEISVDVTDYDLVELERQVESQTAEMYKFCAEPSLNFPLEKDAFPLTRNEALCGFCKYRELCDRA